MPPKEQHHGHGSSFPAGQPAQPDNPLFRQTLPAIREALKAGSVSPAMQAEIDGLMPRALKGEFLNLARPGSAEDVILFFKPPIAFSTEGIYPRLYQDDNIPHITARKGFTGKSEDFVRNFWIFLNRFNRYIISFDPKTITNLDYMHEAHRNYLIPMNDRFTDNFKQAASLMIEGYNGRMRRTGEPFALHSLRTFIGLFADRLPHSIDQTWIQHTSLLASLLHDIREDFKEFSWINIEGDAYLLTCKGKNGKSLQAIFQLTPREIKLLDLQLEALTTPRTSEGTTDAHQAQIQFAHLQEISQQIADDPLFGPLAAFYTLLIKWKDRYDNICTYWERDKDGNIFVDKQNKLNKLVESYFYFRAVENDVKRYLADWVSQPGGDVTLQSKYKTARLELEKYLDSIVRFSQRILFGGQISDIFQEGINAYQKELEEIRAIPDSDSEFREIMEDDFSMKYPYLLPTPQQHSKQTNILQFPLQYIVSSIGFNPLRKDKSLFEYFFRPKRTGYVL